MEGDRPELPHKFEAQHRGEHSKARGRNIKLSQNRNRARNIPVAEGPAHCMMKPLSTLHCGEVSSMGRPGSSE